MSALIVMRPNAGATFDAGWGRVRGTLAGALCGLLGVALQQLGAGTLVTTLAIVAALAFVTAAAPALRSAPIAALIILAAGQLAGHTALQAAVLRVVQIAIGVAVAMAVALASSRYRAADRLETGCASLLRRVSKQLQTPQVLAEPSEDEAESATAAVRGALDRLAMLATSADSESRLFRRGRPAIDARHYHRIVALTGRVVQDVATLKRMLRQGVDIEHDVVQIVSAALASVADTVEGKGKPEIAALRRWIDDANVPAADAAPSDAAIVLLAAPLRLLVEDLERLGQSTGPQRPA
jgi:uncharacterized membrane protein YccC